MRLTLATVCIFQFQISGSGSVRFQMPYLSFATPEGINCQTGPQYHHEGFNSNATEVRADGTGYYY